jgi:hypothetical protein
MRNTMLWISTGLTFLLMAACTGNSERTKQLEGQWTSYMIARGGEAVNQEAVFNFKAGQYTYDIGSHHEEGDYWVEGDKLYTEGPKMMKKKVQIEKLTADTLVLNMNDKGVPMKMGFARSGTAPQGDQ